MLPLSPAEEAKQFWLPPGYHLEPVLSEPDIQEPAQIAFDGNGRMFVVELRGYVQTLDGIDLMPPDRTHLPARGSRQRRRVSSTTRVFVDKLVFPRFVVPFGANSILTMETNADEVWKYTDTNGDGVADKKELFTTNFGRAGNIEHQQASLFWAMDNWLYSTVNALPRALDAERHPEGADRTERRRSGASPRTTTGRCGSRAGASGMPGYFQFPIHYGNFASGSARAESEHHLGSADPDRRHAGRAARHSPAGWLADSRDSGGRQRHLSRRSAARPTWSATICTAKPWRASSGG